jgi:trans-aconitate 2-methyltransferase
VIDDLGLRGGEIVLDAGCGSGSVTSDLLARLPRGRVYAVDSSPDMIEKLSATIAERGATNVIPICASLTDFTLPEQVDVVFSNAVFHWIQDDDGLFGSLYRATRPGGRLRAQCGGAGNIARLMAAAHEIERRRPYVEHIPEPVDARKYRTPDDVKEAMERNGWRGVKASLFGSPVTFDAHQEAALYLRTIILQQQAAMLPEELSEGFLREVIAEVEARHGAPFVADYVRLDIWAQRQA